MTASYFYYQNSGCINGMQVTLTAEVGSTTSGNK